MPKIVESAFTVAPCSPRQDESHRCPCWLLLGFGVSGVCKVVQIKVLGSMTCTRRATGQLSWSVFPSEKQERARGCSTGMVCETITHEELGLPKREKKKNHTHKKMDGLCFVFSSFDRPWSGKYVYKWVFCCSLWKIFTDRQINTIL